MTADQKCYRTPLALAASFRKAARINLQEARVLSREVKDLSRTATGQPKRIVALNDSQVCVGAFSKGRSSSRKLNPILRVTALFLVAMCSSLSLVWIGTHDNPADYPSRFRPLPPITSIPAWAASLFCPAGNSAPSAPFPGSSGRPGLECGSAACGGLTHAFRTRGVPMLDLWSEKLGLNCENERLDGWLREGRVGWLWIFLQLLVSVPCVIYAVAGWGAISGQRVARGGFRIIR